MTCCRLEFDLDSKAWSQEAYCSPAVIAQQPAERLTGTEEKVRPCDIVAADRESKALAAKTNADPDQRLDT